MTSRDQISRHLRPEVDVALSDTRIVAVTGPRQAGKSTLVKQLVHDRAFSTYLTLDDVGPRVAATNDPEGFLMGRGELLAVDEVQRAPELLLAMKSIVDRVPRSGQFLLTGSSHLSTNRAVSETLSGRIERLTLWPCSQGEIAGRKERFVDLALVGDLPDAFESSVSKREYLERAIVGGYPEAMQRTERRRAAWFDTYVETVVEREVPSVSPSSRTASLPTLLRLVAARHTGLLNIADLASDAQLPRTSVQRYLDVLEAVYLIVRLPAWSTNLSQREIRAPKVLVTDSGLAAHLRHASADELARPESAQGADGPILEGFVTNEILRQVGWADERVRLSHYRDRDQVEIDLMIEAGRRVAAIEVKAGASVDARAIQNLARLRDRLGSGFAAGIVLHTGVVGGRLSDRIYSLPISALWEL